MYSRSVPGLPVLDDIVGRCKVSDSSATCAGFPRIIGGYIFSLPISEDKPLNKRIIDFTSGMRLAVLPMCIAAAVMAPSVNAAPNNAPSFTPGFNPVNTPCDGEVEYVGWAQNVTDGDNMTSRLDFRMTGISNADIFDGNDGLPFVSWPSLTLSYKLKPGTPGGSFSTITAVLKDSSGTGQGGIDTSEPQSWTITTEACTDVDLDGIADEIDPEIRLLVDTDGDGVFDDVDLDDDNDGISDIDEGNGVLDTDGDGIPDSLDTDSDNDGLLDVAESGNGNFDIDGDGMIDGEVDSDGNPVNSDGSVTDTDSDGIPDAQEPNGDDVSTDTDGDGIFDDVDTDDDGDGVSDIDEGDGAIDSDGDGVPDSRDPNTINNGGQVVTVQSGPINSLVETGVSGGGCTLGSGTGFDPLFLMSGLLAVAGLRRRKM